MSTGAILTVLSNIPWSQVVESAPKIADGAAKLWSAVTSFRKSSEAATQIPESATSKPLTQTEVLLSRVQSLEDTVKALQEQIQLSSEVIKGLAEQNAQLVNRIELNRLRLQRIIVVGSMAGGALLALIAFLVLRQ